MKIKILRTTVADARFVRAGNVEDVSDKDAQILILLGKAVAVEAEEAPAVVGLTEEELNTKVAEAAIETKLKRTKKLKG